MVEPYRMNTIFQTASPQEFSWKGKTFKQIYAAIKQNRNDQPVSSTELFRAQPLKHYRKEVVTNVGDTCSEQRHATKIDALMCPQGTSTTMLTGNNLVVTMHTKDTVACHAPTCATMPADTKMRPTHSIEDHAKMRVRSSGIVKPSYNANYKQYLERRSKTFAQNQYHFSRDDVTVAQGTADPPTCSAHDTYFEVQSTWKPSNRAFKQDGGQMSSAQTVRLRTNAELVLETPSKQFPKQFPIRTVPVFPLHAKAMQRCQYKKT